MATVRSMEIVLLRHAQPEWDRARQAQIDPDLTDLGRRQAALTADRLAGERFDAMLVSTATRARSTAAPLQGRVAAGRTVERAWLHEIRMPEHWQGSPSEEIGRALRDARRRPREQWWDGMPGGESFRDFDARVATGLRDELASFGLRRGSDRLWQVPEDELRVLVVAHAGTNSLILGQLLGLQPEPWEWERFASDHASLTFLHTVPIASGHIFTLQRFSEVAHLPDELVSA